MTSEEKMRMTVELARSALNAGEMPISAIVFYNDEIISKAYTSEKTDKRFLVHAELKALIEADMKGYSVKQRKEMQLFTTLEPCMMCLGSAMTFFIGEIYYSLEAPSDGAISNAIGFWEEGCKELPAYRLPKLNFGLLRDEVKKLFGEYAEMNVGKPMYNYAKSLAEL